MRRKTKPNRTARLKQADTDIPTLVREVRERLHMTQEQFAHKVGVTYSTVNHWENGKRLPLPFLLRRLLEIKEEFNQERDKRSRQP